MPKYWVKNYFTHGRFPEVGQKQKTEKKRKREKEERMRVLTMAKLRMAHASMHGTRKPPGPKRLNDGNNNGQATHGARNHAWRMQAVWTKIS